ncbi:gametocyte-specific factor 1 isoform X2 [Ciconia boyciana]|uniref:gametocyte-specific factor 1 isoform X2 n=1 Tax=Ciconia boyciana TaxID=52775 RepID=UPI003BA33DA5
MDPEALVQCPYDKSHQVRVSRLPYHLVKCQRNNPRVARTLATCPFNARHRVPQAKLRSHVASCPDKRQPDLPHEMDTSFGDGMKRPEVPAAWQGPPCQEDWEAELEGLEDPPPFVLNVRTNDLLLPCDSSAPAAPTSRSRGRGATGHPAAAGRFRGPHRAPATLGGEESSEEASDLGRYVWKWEHMCHAAFPGRAPCPPRCRRSLPSLLQRPRAVSCVLRTVPITALQHLPGVLARRVDPAGGETPRVSPPSHGSRGPGGACRVPPPPVWVTRGDPGL